MKTFSISLESLKKFAAELLNEGGFNSDEAKVIATSLVLSECSGHGSHGVMRILEYLKDLKHGTVISGAKFEVIRETDNSLLVDAHYGAGQTIVPLLLERLYAKLKTQAVVSATVRHCGHIGRIGEWVEYPAKRGYAGLLLANDNGTCFHVAPPGGKQSVTSTNPIAFVIPLPDGDFFLSDMSTSAIAFGKVRLARLNGTAVAADCIQDGIGNPTTDANALFAEPQGSILPMGGAQGYKGFALSMFVDMLAAGLSGGQTPPATPDTPYANNFVLTLWNPEFFSGLEHMQAQARKYMDFVRASEPVDPAKPIRLPGDRLNTTRHENEHNGVTLNAGLVESLLKLAAELNVTPPVELVN